MRKYLLIFLVYFTILPIVKMDLTTTFVDLRPLLDIQKNVIEDLQPVIDRRMGTLKFLRREIERYKDELKKATKASEKYFGNPINSITFMIRLTSGLKALENSIKENTKLGFKRKLSIKYPTMFDFDEAIRSLFRLQTVYRLNIEEISDGILKTNFTEDRKSYIEFTSPMTVSDCLEIGKGILKRKDHKRGIPWLLAALRKYETERPVFELKKTAIIQQIIDAYKDSGQTEKYIEWTKKLIPLKSRYKREELEILVNIAQNQLENEQWVIDEVKKESKTKHKPKKVKKPRIDPVQVIKVCGTEQMTNAFKMLCRGEMSVSKKITKRLKCWYHKGYHPFLQLAPIKAEQLFSTPDILMFHDVLSDNEIDVIKNLSMPELRDGKTGYGDPLKRYTFIPKMVHRICKSTFIKKKSEVLDRVVRRISDLSGYTLTKSEYFHVSNYGASGFFIPHYDYWMHNYFDKTYGNRIASFIAYMSEPEQGGATVFLPFGLTVFPRKGSAVLWNNLDAAHKGDRLTCHGACPVLRGSKWLATQWISKLDQELRRPCTSAPETRRAVDLPYPEPRV